MDIQKGVITQFSGGLPVVRPYGSGDALTPPLTNRCVAYDQYGNLKFAQLSVGMVVAFAMFPDGTGVALATM